MKRQVVSLKGGALPIPEVNPDIVEALKSLLTEAKSGHIAGLIYGIVSPEGHIATAWSGNASSNSMIAASAILNSRVLADR